MSIRTFVTTFVATITLAGSALAAPPSRYMPLVKSIVEAAAHQRDMKLAPAGYRDSFKRFGVASEQITGAAPMR